MHTRPRARRSAAHTQHSQRTTYNTHGTTRTTLATQGARTIRAVFRGPERIPGPVAEDAIIYDSQPPAPGPGFKLTAAVVNSTALRLSWDAGAVSEAGSGVSHFLATQRAVYKPPPSCGNKSATGTTVLGVTQLRVPPGAATDSVVVGRLVRRRLYNFRVCPVDKAGNIAPGVLAVGRAL